MYSLARIPVSHRDCTLENFSFDGLEYLREDLKQYLQCKNGLLLSGPPGIGKTHLLVGIYKSIASSLHEGPQGVEFKVWPDFLIKLREGFEKKLMYETTISLVTQTRFLLLDDVSLQGGFHSKVFSRIILGVYDNGGMLLVTTNHPLEEMATFLNTHDLSRLSDVVKLVTMKGEDRRGS